jgi:hypothetical protein
MYIWTFGYSVPMLSYETFSKLHEQLYMYFQCSYPGIKIRMVKILCTTKVIDKVKICSQSKAGRQ